MKNKKNPFEENFKEKDIENNEFWETENELFTEEDSNEDQDLSLEKLLKDSSQSKELESILNGGKQEELEIENKMLLDSDEWIVMGRA